MRKFLLLTLTLVFSLAAWSQEEEEWVTLGYCQFTDGALSAYGANVYAAGEQTMKVEFQESTSESGRYRLVEPYKDYIAEDDDIYDDSVIHYMIVDAQDPDYVYVEEFETGWWKNNLNDRPIGWVYISSPAWVAKEAGLEWTNRVAGTLKDGVINFPKNSLRFYGSERYTHDDTSSYMCNNDLTKIELPQYEYSEAAFESINPSTEETLSKLADTEFTLTFTGAVAVDAEKSYFTLGEGEAQLFDAVAADDEYASEWVLTISKETLSGYEKGIALKLVVYAADAEGLVVNGNNEGVDLESKSYLDFEYTTAFPYTITVDPAEGTSDQALSTFTFSCAFGIAVNENVEASSVVLYSGETEVTKGSSWVTNGTVGDVSTEVTLSLVEAVSSTGTYTLNVPKGIFLLAGTDESEELSLTYRIVVYDTTNYDALSKAIAELRDAYAEALETSKEEYISEEITAAYEDIIDEIDALEAQLEEEYQDGQTLDTDEYDAKIEAISAEIEKVVSESNEWASYYTDSEAKADDLDSSLDSTWAEINEEYPTIVDALTEEYEGIASDIADLKELLENSYTGGALEEKKDEIDAALASIEEAIAQLLTDAANVYAEGIDSVYLDENADAEIYTLDGQKVKAPAKGVYIVNGKKVLVK